MTDTGLTNALSLWIIRSLCFERSLSDQRGQIIECGNDFFRYANWRFIEVTHGAEEFSFRAEQRNAVIALKITPLRVTSDTRIQGRLENGERLAGSVNVDTVRFCDRLVSAIRSIQVLLVNQTDVTKEVTIKREDSCKSVWNSMVKPPHRAQQAVSIALPLKVLYNTGHEPSLTAEFLPLPQSWVRQASIHLYFTIMGSIRQFRQTFAPGVLVEYIPSLLSLYSRRKRRLIQTVQEF